MASFLKLSLIEAISLPFEESASLTSLYKLVEYILNNKQNNFIDWNHKKMFFYLY